VPTFEPFLDWYESRHLSITPELLVRLHQSPSLHALFNDGQSGDAGVSEQVVLVGREFLGWPADGISDRSWAKCGSCRHSLSPRARRNLRHPQVRNATCSGISFAADRR
jgi:hypothetical protein